MTGSWVHGRFAQPETRASASDARVVGEIHHVFTIAESMIPRSNAQALWTALKAFFKDNPSWE